MVLKEFLQCLLDKNMSSTTTHQNDYRYQTAQRFMKSEDNRLLPQDPHLHLSNF